MYLNITNFFANACPMDYSASNAEIGFNAGAVTWQAGCEDSDDYLLLDNDDKREAFREYVKGFGAWESEEIDEWSDNELNALCIQFVSGDMREALLDSDSCDDEWADYEVMAEGGQCSGRISRDTATGEVHYYIGD